MNPANLDYFIHFFNHNRSLTRQQALRCNRLLVRDYAKQMSQSGTLKDTNTSYSYNFLDTLQPHYPKETAVFLSLFENSDGLKFLTHNFDPDSTMDYEGLLIHLKKILEEHLKNQKLPKSLKAILPVILDGPNQQFRNWTDGEGNAQSFYYNSDVWKMLAGKQHPAANQELAPLVEIVRRTFRVVPPMLDDIVNEIGSKHTSFTIKKEKLENADFYTYTYKLREGLTRIFNDIAQHSPNAYIEIRFNRSREGFFIRQIEINHIGSRASDINETLEKLNRGGGAFASIAKDLCGYCNWSVEAFWDDIPYRFNILKDTNTPLIETISPKGLTGFKHILTYYKR